MPEPRKTSTAVARKTPAQSLLETYTPELAAVMPGHVKVDAFIGLAVAQIHASDTLRLAVERNPRSLILALRDCSYLGHVPRKGMFDLVAFKSKDAPGGIEVVGIEEYRAVLERMYRAGAVQSVKVELVREHDHFEWAPTRMRLPVHEFDALASDEERGPLRGVYAWAVMLDGVTVSQVVVMGRGEVMKHKAVAKSSKFWTGPWEPDMWRKTALHKLERFVPTSSEYRFQAATSAAAAGAMQLPPAPVIPQDGPSIDDMDVEDAVVVEDEPPAAEPWPDVPPVPEGDQS